MWRQSFPNRTVSPFDLPEYGAFDMPLCQIRIRYSCGRGMQAYKSATCRLNATQGRNASSLCLQQLSSNQEHPPYVFGQHFLGFARAGQHSDFVQSIVAEVNEI